MADNETKTAGTVVQAVLLANEAPPVAEGQAKIAVNGPVAAPEPLPAPAVVSKAVEQTVATPEAAQAPQAAQPPQAPLAVQNVVAEPAYVCKNKKHANGTAYFIAEGTAFCNLCLRDFFLRHLLKPMTKKAI